MTWVYKGRLALEHPSPEGSFWAPDCVRDDAGKYHLFVTFVPGPASSHIRFGGRRHIMHYSSDDLAKWELEQRRAGQLGSLHRSNLVPPSGRKLADVVQG